MKKKEYLEAGVGTYHNLIIDAMDQLTEERLIERLKVQPLF